MRKLLACLTLSLLTGCAVSSGSCAGWRPILLGDGAADRLTRAEQEQVVGHNDHGEAEGCW